MRERGFTLVELLIGVVIVAILAMLALPSYTEFMGNTRIRNTADSLANGLRQAQVEAIKRNRNVIFSLDGAGWTITDPDPDIGGQVERELFSETNGLVTVTTNPAGSLKLTYSGLGLYFLMNPDDDTAAIRSMSITSPSMSNPHPLRVTADPAYGIGVRVCDTSSKLAAGDPDRCPALVP